MQTLEQKIRKISFQNGLILGVITTFLTIFSFYFITSLSRSALAFILAPILLRAFIPMGAVLFLSFNTRKKIGGLWTFKQATTGIFIMLLTAYVINVIGKDLLFDRLIVPNNVELTQNAAIAAKTSNMKEKGDSPAQIKTSIAEMKKDFVQKDSFTFGTFVTENVFIILFLFVFAIIFASLIRNAVYVSGADKG